MHEIDTRKKAITRQISTFMTMCYWQVSLGEATHTPILPYVGFGRVECLDSILVTKRWPPPAQTSRARLEVLLPMMEVFIRKSCNFSDSFFVLFAIPDMRQNTVFYPFLRSIHSTLFLSLDKYYACRESRNGRRVHDSIFRITCEKPTLRSSSSTHASQIPSWQ